MNLIEMKKSSFQATNLMKAMSNENRLMLLCLLNDGEKSVSELAKLVELRQSTVSQQLTLLRKDKLVKTRRASQEIYYSLEGQEVKRVIAVLYDIYC